MEPSAKDALGGASRHVRAVHGLSSPAVPEHSQETVTSSRRAAERAISNCYISTLPTSPHLFHRITIYLTGFIIVDGGRMTKRTAAPIGRTILLMLFIFTAIVWFCPTLYADDLSQETDSTVFQNTDRDESAEAADVRGASPAKDTDGTATEAPEQDSIELESSEKEPLDATEESEQHLETANNETLVSQKSSRDAIAFLYIESPEVRIGSVERIAVGLEDGSAPISASLTYCDLDGNRYEVSAATFADDALLFEIVCDENTASTAYSLVALEYSNARQTVTVDISDQADSATFVVLPNGDAQATDVDSTYLTVNSNGEVGSSDSLEDAINDAEASVPSTMSEATSSTIALDPGHGGWDSGAEANGIVESEINLKIASYCKDELKSNNYDVLMTRTDDSYVGLEERVDIARRENARLFVSFHINSGGGQGVEVWIPAKSTWYSSFHEFGETLGNNIIDKLEALGLDSHGLMSDYHSSNPDGSAGDYLSVIRNSRKYGIPAVLIEHGYIDNASDAAFLKEESNLKKLGIADAEAISSVSIPQRNLVFDESGLRLVKDDGSWASSEWAEVDGGRYYFGEDGYALSGEQWIDGSLYLFDDKTFAAQTGWHTWTDGRRSYFSPKHGGAAAKGWWTLGGRRYYFGDSRRAYRYGNPVDGKYYYFGSTGAVQTGWHTWTDGRRSYFSPKHGGAAGKGWWTIGGKRYYFNPSDVRRRALLRNQTIDGKRYYFDSDGSMHTGWLYWNSDGKWSYFGSNGIMYTGTHTIDGVKYSFGTSGKTKVNPVQSKMASKAQRYSSSTNWLILVDTTNNYLGVYRGRAGAWNQSKFWICSTGAYSTPTVLGQYTVTGKGYSFGHGYTCYYYTQFYGDYLIHSNTFYQGTFNIMDGRMGVNISQGCVRLPLDRAKWIYDNIPYGTKVVTYR